MTLGRQSKMMEIEFDGTTDIASSSVKSQTATAQIEVEAIANSSHLSAERDIVWHTLHGSHSCLCGVLHQAVEGAPRSQIKENIKAIAKSKSHANSAFKLEIVWHISHGI
jgi:hypothetical protein